MARSYGRIHTGVWRDDDFRKLEPVSKLVYLALITQHDISAIGLLSLATRRWQASLGLTRDELHAALDQLAEQDYIVVDYDTEELLVRTFVKWDGGAANAQRRTAIVAAACGILSPIIAAVAHREMERAGVLSVPQDGPGHALPHAPSHGASDSPSHGASDGSPDGLRVVVTKEGNWNNPQPTTQEPGGGRPSQAATPPRCIRHSHLPVDDPGPPCPACKRLREQWEAQTTEANRAARAADRAAHTAAIAACPDCDPDGWALDAEGAPTALRCTHPTIAQEPTP